jgi:hypothetical protein
MVKMAKMVMAIILQGRRKVVVAIKEGLEPGFLMSMDLRELREAEVQIHATLGIQGIQKIDQNPPLKVPDQRNLVI